MVAAQWIDRRDAEILLANCWGLTRSQLLARCGESVPSDVAECFGKAVTKRSEGVSVAYLLRRREFWSLTFEVSPAVLVPRPETELVVQRALALVRLPVAEIADLGTGSGAIAIALSHERPQWAITGTDVSTGALEVARRNGAALVESRVRWVQGDWYAALARHLAEVEHIAQGLAEAESGAGGVAHDEVFRRLRARIEGRLASSD